MINYSLTNKLELIKFFKKYRWEDGIHCPHCNCFLVWRYGYTKDGFQRYRCKKCNKTFSDKTNTLMHYSRIPIEKVIVCFLLFFYIHTSSSKLCFVCDVSNNSFKRIINNIMLEKVILNGDIELDEMYLRSGLKGKHYSKEIKDLGRKPRRRGLKRHKRGRGIYDEDMCPLLSIVKRKGLFYLIPIKTASEKDIKKEVLKYCDMNSTFYTDEWKSYNFLMNRKMVIHSKKQYSIGNIHINTAEGLHNLFRIFMSVHMGVNKKNLEKYIKWFVIMKKSMQKKDEYELIEYFVSLLVQERK